MMIIPKKSKRSGNKYIIIADDYVWCDIIKTLTIRNLQRKKMNSDRTDDSCRGTHTGVCVYEKNS